MEDKLTIVGRPISVGELGQMLKRVQEEKKTGKSIDVILAEEAVKNKYLNDNGDYSNNNPIN